MRRTVCYLRMSYLLHSFYHSGFFVTNIKGSILLNVQKLVSLLNKTCGPKNFEWVRRWEVTMLILYDLIISTCLLMLQPYEH